LINTKHIIIASLLVVFAIGFFVTSDAFAQSTCCLEVSTNRSVYDHGSSITLDIELEGQATSSWRANNPASYTITSYYVPSNSTYNVVAQGTTELNQYSGNFLKSRTSIPANWDWTGQYTITVNLGSEESTLTFLYESNSPIPSVPIAQSSADTSAMCCVEVRTGHAQYWINDPDTDAVNGKGNKVSDKGKAPTVKFEMEGYATSAWRANNNAIVQIFDSEQNLLITQEAEFNPPNSQNIMKGHVFFDKNSLNHATTSGLYTASVTIGSLQGTDTFFFHADCIAYCDSNDLDNRALKQTATTTTTPPTPEPDPEPTPDPEPEPTPEPEPQQQTTTTTTTESTIPDWVRNIFIWYANEQISESDLLNAIEFLANQGIINLE